jgi:hypothetical protein
MKTKTNTTAKEALRRVRKKHPLKFLKQQEKLRQQLDSLGKIWRAGALTSLRKILRK